MWNRSYPAGLFALNVVAGFAFGFILLHPASMVIFAWLDPHFAHAMGGSHRQEIWGPILDSFLPGMFPMGIVYGLICSFLAVMNGYQGSTIQSQRDDLARELRQNTRYQGELEMQARLLEERNEQLARLEYANRRTAQFMAHDLKTHLGCILGFTNLLMEKHEKIPAGERLVALQRIRRQSHQMMGEIGDLLDFTRLQETGKLHLEEVAVAQLLVEAVTDFSLPEHGRQVSIGTLSKACPPVLADRRVLRRVLTNLVSNALKHNPPDTHVLLGASLAERGSSVIFSCHDDGEGISIELLPAIFGNFSTRANGIEVSAGLGLAFCKSAVEAHGGRIWCDSSQGNGTRFSFTIPAVKEGKDERGIGI
jgi:signal transduction histidine kinase